jgi:nitrite reductase/ring-hydroxylating ferredoxin subunit
MRVDLGPEADVRDGQAKCVTANERALALFRVGGRIYCLDNRCTHMGGPLCRGSLNVHVVTCPWHGSRFDVRTGQVVGPPASSPVHANTVIVENGRIFVELP